MAAYIVYWEYLINLMEVILFVLFAHTRMTKVSPLRHRTLWQILFIAFEVVMLCLLNRFSTTSYAAIVSCVLVDICYLLIFYRDSVISRIFTGCLYSVLCMIADFMGAIIPQLFFGISPADARLGGELRMPLTLLYIALIAVFVFLFHFNGNQNMFLSIGQRILFLIQSIGGLILGHFIILITIDVKETSHNMKLVEHLTLANLFYIMLFLSLLWYVYRLGDSKAQNVKLLEQQKVLELEEQEYKNLIQTTESLREMKHDMQIHLDMIEELASQGKTDELQAFIREYDSALTDAHHLLSTGNPAIDCIVSRKLEQAHQAGITTEFSVVLQQKIPLDTLTLSSLLGNLWNNAIEACQMYSEQAGAEHPFIRFAMKPYQNMILIHIENSYDGILNRASDGTLLSRKNQKGHGIGLKRISDIVSQANGILQISPDDHIFCVRILIPEKE